jgi:C_GCAxxG_C_C family probable redox protein
MEEKLTDPIQTASDRFAQGFNCSQAIFSAFASSVGITDESALKISSPFGGGFARQGQVCGVLTGALMILGLQHGNINPEGKEHTYKIAEEFLFKFKERHGVILCRELIGCDISSPAGLQTARERNLFNTICPTLVKETAKLLSEFSIK